MTYLLDTNVVSETRRSVRNPGVTAWIESTPIEHQHLSALTVGEIGRGIARLRARQDHEPAALFERWLDGLVALFERRVVPITSEIGREWGRQDPGHPIATVDGLLGATAVVHGWTVVTRNVAHLERTGAQVLDPFTT